MIVLVFLPVLAALGWVFFQISGPAFEQLDRDFAPTGDEGSTLGDFRDLFGPVRKGPWTQQTPVAQRNQGK